MFFSKLLGESGHGDGQRAALFEALSIGSVFMDRAIWSECVEYEGEGDVVRDIDKLITLPSLYDDVTDITPGTN